MTIRLIKYCYDGDTELTISLNVQYSANGLQLHVVGGLKNVSALEIASGLSKQLVAFFVYNIIQACDTIVSASIHFSLSSLFPFQINVSMDGQL